MALFAPITPVKLFVGVLFLDEIKLEEARKEMIIRLGKIDYESPIFPFDITNYYNDEMGDNILRKFYSFEQLISPEEIITIKHFTNDLEQKLAIDNKRHINLDPGYMDYHKIILASFKEGAPKIYLGKGIWADPTLWYSKGQFHPYSWGDPDYRAEVYNDVLVHIRELYKRDLKNKK